MMKIIYNDGSFLISEYSWEYEGDPDFKEAVTASESEVIEWNNRVKNDLK